MGANLNIDIDIFPKQAGEGDLAPVGCRVNVCFHFDLRKSKMIGGKVIRHDIEAPGLLIFQLDDGRVVLSTECMWSLSKDTMQ